MLWVTPGFSRAADPEDKYPFDPQLHVLAEDVKYPTCRRLVTQKMLATDLAAEWQRVATSDNPESFLSKLGGRLTWRSASDAGRGGGESPR